MPAPDLDAYFARLGYTGPREPTLATLRALQLAHLSAIPFENLDVLLGRGIRIDLAAVEDKLVRQRRGGYCFEQNTLFSAVLCALGFEVTPLLARVRWGIPPAQRTPLTHMILRVTLDGRPWLADAGFGGVAATAPLALDTTAGQTTPHDLRRLVREDRTLTHQLFTADGWTDVYTFTLDDPAPVDFELGNWYSCTHPQGHFLNNLIVTRVAGDRRLALFNREFSIRHPDGRVEKEPVDSPARLLTLLAEHFDLRFPTDTRFGAGEKPWPN